MVKTIAGNIAFGLNCLLLFLAISDQVLALPAWLQVTGRMHPLWLHFPIALLIAATLAEYHLTSQPSSEKKILTGWADALLLMASLTAPLTAVMGWFLSQEPGYENDVLDRHRWSGLMVSLLAYTWYAGRTWWRKNRFATWMIAVGNLSGVVLAGHFGAVITHGADYLWEPLQKKSGQSTPLPDSARLYTEIIQPIFEKKCNSCHNQNKAKGKLILETEEGILKGGKNGALWDIQAPDLGLMMQRIRLPLVEKKHMPPAGKTQLTALEIAIIEQWIKAGSPFDKRIADLEPTDSLHQLAMTWLKPPDDPYAGMPFPDPDLIRMISSHYCVVQPIARYSPALRVHFFGASHFKSDNLKALEKLKNQIVELRLGHMTVQDQDIPYIAALTQLRLLDLSFTRITGKTLPALKTLRHLQTLSLTGTQIHAQDLDWIDSLPELNAVYVWNTGLSSQEMEALSKRFPRMHFEDGFRGDTIVTRLTMPLFRDDELLVFQGDTVIELKHFVKDADIRYTLDGREPDSVHSAPYEKGVRIDKSLVFKAKAFLTGWLSSQTLERQFYKRGFQPDSIRLVKLPNPQYAPNGRLLCDGKKGDTNFKSGKWQGYRENGMEAWLTFDTAVIVSNVVFSSLTDIGSYIMPPLNLQIWGGNSPASMSLLSTERPAQPVKGEPAYLKGYECAFPPRRVRVLKLVATPVARLPAWHPGKGDRGWFFVDEIFIN